ncbi:hypothetical protein AQUCO_00800259v1 [Aquilegia coerulea]|uniref:DUF4283 domain-containing protein n=1 Tax=Aquilegia coerulea TaxID=218851 RepID=A0A2G5EHW3_AQUCA|nr:hypothetical protein AQUCO_00800259v1 [Aquilegia coerulea]
MDSDLASSSSRGVQKGSWSSLFPNVSRDSACNLEWIDSETIGGATVVPRDIIDQGINLWKDYLVGFFVDKRMPFFLVKRTVEREWKLKGGLEIKTDGKLYYFKFGNLEERQRVFEGGPIFVVGRIMVIREWSEDVYEFKEHITSVPIWVRCYDVPMQLWSPKGLSFIGSKIGKPRCCDEITVKRERLDYARLCIEVPADTTYPTTLRFDMGNGKIAVVGVEYSWKPQVCTHCKVFGHMTRNCPHTTVWAPKQKTAEKEATQEVEKVTEGSNLQVAPLKETEEVHQIHLDATVNDKIGRGQSEGAASTNRYEAIAEYQEEEVNNPLAFVVREVEPILAVEECQEESLDAGFEEEVVPCSLVEGKQDMEEEEENTKQYKDEQHQFQLLCKDGQPEILAQEVPLKEVEVFKDHILKPKQTVTKVIKGKGIEKIRRILPSHRILFNIVREQGKSQQGPLEGAHFRLFPNVESCYMEYKRSQ